MPTLPFEIVSTLSAFAPLFSRRVFEHVKVLLAGAILTPGSRTVTNCLRVMGLSDCLQFQNYHRVLNRAQWSSRKAARTLLLLLVGRFAPDGPLVFGIDETLERRKGKRIAAKGLFHDASRSGPGSLVRTSALRWVSLMLLCPVGWAKRVWAMPVFTVLAPPERYHKERGVRHKRLSDWTRQMLLQLRRWLPHRQIVVVGDNNYAVLSLLRAVSQWKEPVTMVTRLRLDAALYAPAPDPAPGQKGRRRVKGERLPSLLTVLEDKETVWETVVLSHWYEQTDREVQIASGTCVWYSPGQPVAPIRWVLVRDPQGKFSPGAFLCTDTSADPVKVLQWFVLRWQVEVTFEETRAHLGMETQRQWNPLAILRTTPALLALFSVVTLMADTLMRYHDRKEKNKGDDVVRKAAWYVKEQPTFSDALALVRRELWTHYVFCLSHKHTDIYKMQDALVQRFTDALCYAT